MDEPFDLPQAGLAPARIVHSSDLHLGVEGPGQCDSLESVIAAARRASADILLLAGDVFDHNRVSLRLIDEATRLLSDSGMEVVVLPGNHDCLVPDSVYRRGGLGEPGNVHILGLDAESLTFPELDLAIWGRPHHNYSDMRPLAEAPSRTARRQVLTAHGHWLTPDQVLRRSWLLSDDELHAVDADYVALGHIDRHTLAERSGTLVSYSGSPNLARTVNLVIFDDAGMPTVTRVPLEPDSLATSESAK